MTKQIFLCLLVFFPVCIFAQSSIFESDTASKRAMQNDCHDQIFTRVENIASLSTSKEIYEDSLTSFLKAKRAFFNNGGIIFQMIVTTRSDIFNIEVDSGRIRKEAIVKGAILHFSNLWNPAVQNGRAVCSYVRLKIDIREHRLNVTTMQ